MTYRTLLWVPVVAFAFLVGLNAGLEWAVILTAVILITAWASWEMSR